MATLKITERPQVPALKNGASLLITQQETVDGQPVEALRRIEANPLLAPPIIKTATGEVVAVSDSAQRPFAGLRLYGKTTQYGTPTPDTPATLANAGAGGSIGAYARGKNLIPSFAKLDAWFAGLPNANDNPICDMSIAAGTYTFTVKTDSGITRANVIDVTLADEKNQSVVTVNSSTTGGYLSLNKSNAFTITPEQAVRIRRINIFYNYNVDSTRVNGERLTEMQIESGTAATAYEPYKDGGNLTASTPNGLPGIPVSSGGNYTDASGQMWLCDEKDYGRGVYVQRVGVRVFDDLEELQQQHHLMVPNYLESRDVQQFNIYAANTSYGDTVCNIVQNNKNVTGGNAEGVYSINDNLLVYGIKKDALTAYGAQNTAESLRTAMLAYIAAMINAGTPIKTLYPLATPTETPLNPEEIAAYSAMTSLYPNTTVYTDADAGLGVDYIADTEQWSKASQTSMIGAIEPGMVASKNYAAGDFIVDQDTMTLYRATAPIAKGEAIKPGTNCTATTVVEQLAALYSLINR